MPAQGPLRTFAIFALIGPVVGALVLFLPHAITFFRWVAYDSVYWWTLLDAALLVYPLGVWPGLIAGALVVWRDRAAGATTLRFAIAASVAAGAIWLVVFNLAIFRLGTAFLFSETSLYRIMACVIAGIACWWLSRAKTDAAPGGG